EGVHFTLEDNGFSVEPGDDVAFTLHLDDGYSVTAVHYDGPSAITNYGTSARVTLKNVRFPTRVSVEVAGHFRTVIYDPNGAGGEAVSRVYNLETKPRPNVSIGTDIFERPGFVLESWNTQPDGSGERIGLGSRMTVDEDREYRLYAQWARWTDPGLFTFAQTEEGLEVTGYTGTEKSVTIPETVEGKTVEGIGAGALKDLRSVVLPKSIRYLEEGAFTSCKLDTLTLYDNLSRFGDSSFRDCTLKTLRINAILDPWGYEYRRESCFADKIDMLIEARGQKKLVFYGGCSMWYNLAGEDMQKAFPEYKVINAAVNGVINSYTQMCIIEKFLEPGDIFFHTPELCSPQQLLLNLQLIDHDNKFWCAMDYNYDLVTLLDLREFTGGVFDSLQGYWAKKKPGGSYVASYRDSAGNSFMDETGSASFIRYNQADKLQDSTFLDPDYLRSGLPKLCEVYSRYAKRGVTVYVSCAAVNAGSLPEGDIDKVQLMQGLFSTVVSSSGGARYISNLADYLFGYKDFYDTNFHLLSEPTHRVTELWIRDLRAAMGTK
ncbi:MAG: leucine-rich repeat protein, partial [Oscillospiraceae bacterium]|nr:leucine-rich repeat protein [Oscillospiraceae bacterium]